MTPLNPHPVSEDRNEVTRVLPENETRLRAMVHSARDIAAQRQAEEAAKAETLALEKMTERWVRALPELVP